jgi:SEC-C motif domain protein
MTCPCGKGPSQAECCGPYLSGEARPDTAEALMRSRYTAYVTAEIDYIVATHDPATRDGVDQEGAGQWATESTWHGLEIVETTGGGPDDDSGEVEFIARYSVGPKTFAHHEHAHFRRIDGAWHYIDGHMIKPKPQVRETPKVGRNEPCPCGSGTKYKKCCGAAA